MTETRKSGIREFWNSGPLPLLAALLVLASRLPAILFPRELNADEGQMLAQAMRAAVDPVPWRSFDGTTSGPFNTWLLRLAPPSYSAAHLLAALCWTLTVACGFVTASRLFGRTAAAIATCAAAAWLVVNQNADFVHYSSETLSVALLGAALAAGAQAEYLNSRIPEFQHRKSGIRDIWNSGLPYRGLAAILLGIVPWAKLQAAPIAAVVGLWLIVDAARRSNRGFATESAKNAEEGDAGEPRPRAVAAPGALPLHRGVASASRCERPNGDRLARFRPPSPVSRLLPSVAVVIGAAALPTAAMTIAVWRGGALGEMWESYFVANARYAGSPWSGEFWSGAGAMFLSWPLCPWILALIALGAISGIPGCRNSGIPEFQNSRVPDRRDPGLPEFRKSGILAIALTIVSAMACLRPTLRLQHHQLLMLPSLILLTAAVVRRLETHDVVPRLRWWAAAVLASYVACRAGDAWSTLRQRAETLSRPTSASVVLQDVHAVAPGAHSVLAWGWFPSLYVQGGITPPTRHVISQWLDAGLPGEAERRATFLAELAAAPPDVLVDSSERGMERMFGLSPHMAHFPALADFVHANYGEAVSVATPSGPVRIFVRKGWHEHEAGALHADD